VKQDEAQLGGLVKGSGDMHVRSLVPCEVRELCPVRHGIVEDDVGLLLSM